MRHCGTILALAFALAIATTSDGMAFELQAANTTFEAVYVWNSERCDDITIPDSPARAVRLSKHNLLLMAAHYNNVPLTGRDFASLKPECRAASRGKESANSEDSDDRFWVQALIPDAKGGVLGLASHEYKGQRHAGHCNAPASDRTACWYSSIVATRRTDRDPSFRLLALAQRIVAAPSAHFTPDLIGRSGFFSTTNVVRLDHYFYALMYVEGVAGQPSGNCLFRAPVASPLDWRALSGAGDNWTSYAAGRDSNVPAPPACQVIGKGIFSQYVSSLLYLEPAHSWVAIFSKRSPAGVFYAASPDLIHWSPAKLLINSIEPWADPKGCGVYYAYPSVIDHDSISNIFDTSSGKNLWLYMTRFNFKDCNKGLNRDLVRLSINVVTTR